MLKDAFWLHIKQVSEQVRHWPKWADGDGVEPITCPSYDRVLKPEIIAYMCPNNCGCLWRDNKDGTMSLFGPNSRSCSVCEFLPLAKLIPLRKRK